MIEAVMINWPSQFLRKETHFAMAMIILTTIARLRSADFGGGVGIAFSECAC
jgi:hypothetical protein